MHPRRKFCLCLTIILCMGTAACTSLFKNYGRIDPSDEATRAFEEYQVNPQYRYYVSGPHINPNAIMGLDRNYRLDPWTSWREVDMTPELLKELIRGMKAQVFGNYAGLYGFEISDNNGRPIGVWYSILQARTFVKMNPDGTVRIDTPPLLLYNDFGEDNSRDHGPGLFKQ
jgi:hypothetical protein